MLAAIIAQPTMMSEYPRVDGHLSNACYLRSLDLCYQRFADKYYAKTGKFHAQEPLACLDHPPMYM
jgi:3-hydroxy-3-methylglutaryl CoA synthase